VSHRALICLLSLFGAFPARAAPDTATLQAGGATLDLRFTGGAAPDVRQAALDWAGRAAKAVTVYYGQFPVPRVRVDFEVGGRPGSGRTWGDDVPRIRIGIGRSLASGALDVGGNDWVLTHEMVHLALPSVEEEHHWLEEGLATYVEPVARVRAGELSAARVWGDMAEGMPKGEPRPGDQGLDRTPTWGRTYWGGAIFCLVADVRIREATGNRAGLETALRGVLRAGGSIRVDWPAARVLDVGDQAAGVAVLRPLYEQMHLDPVPVDLDGLWRRLGVDRHGGQVTLDEAAPLAAIRRSIMAP
jgi:hypothetical protein